MQIGRVCCSNQPSLPLGKHSHVQPVEFSHALSAYRFILISQVIIVDLNKPEMAAFAVLVADALARESLLVCVLQKKDGCLNLQHVGGLLRGIKASGKIISIATSKQIPWKLDCFICPTDSMLRQVAM